MKKRMELIRQQFEENDKKKTASLLKLESLQANRADLEARIDEAIKSGDQATAEKLIRNRIDVDVQIEIAEKSISILDDMAVERSAVAEAWKDDCDGFQRQIDKSLKELHQIVLQAAEKALEASDLINAAWHARTAALRLIKNQEPNTLNAGNTDFAYPSGKTTEIMKVRDLLSLDELRQIRQDAGAVMGAAVRDKSNPYFRPV